MAYRADFSRNPQTHFVSLAVPPSKVTVEVAIEIFELNAGLNALLFSTSLEASIEIMRLRPENERWKKTTRTTIATKAIGEEVQDDNAVHVVWNCITVMQLHVCNANYDRMCANDYSIKLVIHICQCSTVLSNNDYFYGTFNRSHQKNVP
ncbi:hypothetical protein GBA52_004803 [Prunus armeniaca]|nr:hypothetical protein GBA52_004803 [Prunus armeniaca]